MTPDPILSAIINAVVILICNALAAGGVLIVVSAQRAKNKTATETTNVEAERLRQEAYDKQNRFFFDQYKDLTTRIDNSNSEVAALKERAKVLDEIYQKDRAALVKSIADQQTQIDGLLIERDTLKKERNDAIIEKNTAQQNATSQQDEIAELREQLATANKMQVERDRDFEARIQKLEEQMTSLTAERDSFKERAEAAEQRAEAEHILRLAAERRAQEFEVKYNDLALLVTAPPAALDPVIVTPEPQP